MEDKIFGIKNRAFEDIIIINDTEHCSHGNGDLNHNINSDNDRGANKSILTSDFETNANNFRNVRDDKLKLYDKIKNDSLNYSSEIIDGASSCINLNLTSLNYGESENSDENTELDKQNGGLNVKELFKYKLKGPVSSFREKKPKKKFKRVSLREETPLESKMLREDDVARSEYSLVSTGELTSGALQLWLGLPDEVKYDPALEQFRQYYEKEHGADDFSLASRTYRKLPNVQSAPHLNNNVRKLSEDADFKRGKKDGKVFTFSQNEKTEKIPEEVPESKKTSKMARASHIIKISLLVAIWIFFTVIFLMYNEKETISRRSSVAPGEIKSYILDTTGNGLSIEIQLTGPFISPNTEQMMNATEKTNRDKIEVWLEKWRSKNGSDVIQSSEHWSIILDEADQIDFSIGQTRTFLLKLEPTAHRSIDGATYAVRMNTTSSVTTPFSMSYTISPLDVSTGVLCSCILLLALYGLIVFEVINRTMASLVVSTCSLAVLAMVGERPSLPELISWLDMETLMLLFSMMVLVAILAETGLFDYLAVYTFQVTKGKIWPLVSLLSAVTAGLSTFLDNVTTVLLMTPVTIRLCEVMSLDPIPVLMSMVLYSNIGGAMTPVGDPPNVIIASNKDVIDAGINFANFTIHMSLGILLVCLQTYFQFRFIYRDTKKLRLNEPRDILELRSQIAVWRRAAEALPNLSGEHQVVKRKLEKKIEKLTSKLEELVKETKIRACTKANFESMLTGMRDKYNIRDKALLVKSTVAVTFVVLVFFLHAIPEFKSVSLGWTALLGALLLLTLADREDLEPILHRVEWSTLLFFAALFVLMEALTKLGFIKFIGGLTENLILKVDESSRLTVAILILLWVSGLTSAFLDNIPLTTMMIRVVTSLGTNPVLNLPMAPLIWALSFGACLGGNGTLIGASANVVCAGVAEHHGYKFTFLQFFKTGFPIMIGHLVVVSAYLLMCHCVFSWH